MRKKRFFFLVVWSIWSVRMRRSARLVLHSYVFIRRVSSGRDMFQFYSFLVCGRRLYFWHMQHSYMDQKIKHFMFNLYFRHEESEKVSLKTTSPLIVPISSCVCSTSGVRTRTRQWIMTPSRPQATTLHLSMRSSLGACILSIMLELILVDLSTHILLWLGHFRA